MISMFTPSVQFDVYVLRCYTCHLLLLGALTYWVSDTSQRFAHVFLKNIEERVRFFFSSCFVISIFIAVNTFSTVAPLIAWLLVIYHSLTTALILVCDVYLFPIYILKHHIDIRLYYQWFSWISTTKCQIIYVQTDNYTDLIRNSQDKIIDMY